MDYGDCVKLSKCPFFHDKMANMPSMADLMKQNYCQGDWSRCARYRIFNDLGNEYIPADLFPNEQDRATQVLKDGWDSKFKEHHQK